MTTRVEIAPRQDDVPFIKETFKTLGALKQISPEKDGNVRLVYETQDLPRFKEAAEVQSLSVRTLS